MQVPLNILKTENPTYTVQQPFASRRMTRKQTRFAEKVLEDDLIPENRRILISRGFLRTGAGCCPFGPRDAAKLF